jgi:hypothetical protein
MKEPKHALHHMYSDCNLYGDGIHLTARPLDVH